MPATTTREPGMQAVPIARTPLALNGATAATAVQAMPPGVDTMVTLHAPKPLAPRWIPVTEELPDSDLTVLISLRPGADYSEPVWMGYLEGDEWHTVEGETMKTGDVLAWQNLPDSYREPIKLVDSFPKPLHRRGGNRRRVA